MTATTTSMFLYSLTLQPPASVTQAILGNFSGTKEQQIITASGSRLVLNRPDPTQGKIDTIISHDVFGIIRTLAAFRLAGSNKGMSYTHNPLEERHSDSRQSKPISTRTLNVSRRLNNHFEEQGVAEMS